MPYIGTQPLTGQFKKLDAITVVNGQAAYTMNYNSAAYKPATANALLVSVNGVIQAAGDAYTINGSTITFTENLVTGDVIDFIIALGDTGSAVTPVDGSVTTAKLANDAVTTAKLADSAVTTAKLPAGTILQVVSDDDNTNTAMTSSYADYLSVNITPQSTSSKILIMANVPTYHVSAGSVGAMKLVRDSSNLNYEVGDYYHDSGTGVPGNLNITMVDSPATTSQVNYKIQIKEEAGSVETNKDYSGTTNGIASLVVMEIAG